MFLQQLICAADCLSPDGFSPSAEIIALSVKKHPNPDVYSRQRIADDKRFYVTKLRLMGTPCQPGQGEPLHSPCGQGRTASITTGLGRDLAPSSNQQ